MNRTEQLAFCKRCTNRKMDLQQGIICSITDQKADFTDECADFNQDAGIATIAPGPLENEEEQELINLPNDILDRLRLDQNLPAALISGTAAGILGAILWAVITVVTEYQIGYMALAIGAAVGFTMRHYGRGIDQIFGVSGAIIAVVSCLLGNFFSTIGFIAQAEGLGYVETLLLFDYAYLVPVMTETFSMIDLVFYGIAGYEGYKFAFRIVTQGEVKALSGQNVPHS